MLDRVEAAIQLEDNSWLVLQQPVRIVEARGPKSVVEAIASVEALTRDLGCHAVWYVAYEAGAAFGLAVCQAAGDLPQAWFALFERQNVHTIERSRATSPYELGPLAASIGPEAFARAFEQIKRHLADGDTYQVNYTFRMECSFKGDPRSLFWDLVAAQEGRYSAFIHTGNHSICSASPELFFSRKGTVLAARPMKGTARRGRTLDEDRRQAEELRSSDKQRAENVMIVDMVRNDLGRIARIPLDRQQLRNLDAAHLFVAGSPPALAAGRRARRALVPAARGSISEGVVTIDDLRSASHIWLINSVHEWRPAVMS